MMWHVYCIFLCFCHWCVHSWQFCMMGRRHIHRRDGDQWLLFSVPNSIPSLLNHASDFRQRGIGNRLHWPSGRRGNTWVMWWTPADLFIGELCQVPRGPSLSR
eukprot:6194873-Amphidinium_carterae.1